MPRLSRFCPSGHPCHIIQRGNDRQDCFLDAMDFSLYASWLKNYSHVNRVSIHAWVFMTNHVHLLATPEDDFGISKLMQSLGRNYVRYFNKKYHRTGTLWEGRFKSCLVDTENYLFNCYRYIEENPVRAKMVSHPEHYKWSSYHCNANGKESKLCKPHPLYLELGMNDNARQRAYEDLFEGHLRDSIVNKIRKCINTGDILGDELFIDGIEKKHNITIKRKKVGRPKKNNQHTT